MSRSSTDARRKLGAPTLAMLPRVADSLSFLYMESVRVTQDATGVRAHIETAHGIEKVYVPTAALACVLLGPGVSITQPAMATFARHGTTLICVGAGGARSYANIVPASLTTGWLEKQARIWADDTARTAAAIRMYRQRFSIDVPDGTSVARLRGMEGQRVKAHYRILAAKHGITRFRRNYDPDAWDTQDPVNLALSAANACLYGAVHAAISALGCSPALGLIHSGTQQAFVYDIADLYKADVTIPLAFALHNSSNPEREARAELRDQFRLLKLLPTIIRDTQHILDPDNHQPAPDRTPDITHLWDPDLGAMPAGVNYSGPEHDNELEPNPNDPGHDDPLAPGATGTDDREILRPDSDDGDDPDDVLINLGQPWPQ